MVIAGRVSSASFSEGSKDKNRHNWAEQTRSRLMLGEFKCGWVAHPANITAGTISVAAEAVKWSILHQIQSVFFKMWTHGKTNTR